MSRPLLPELSDRELLRSLNYLVCRERSLRVEILNYLNEVDRRKLHVRLGHSSLFDYCTSRLHYSSSAAWRRIASARAMRRFPEIGTMLTSGEVNLVTIAMIAKLLTPANKDALLGRIRGRSQEAVRGIVAEYRPEEIARDRVRPVCVKVTAFPAQIANPVETGVAQARAVRTSDEGSRDSTPTSGSEPAANAMADTEPPRTTVVSMHEITFLADQKFMKKLEQVKTLLATRNPSPTLEEAFHAAMEAFLEAKCPLRRAERRRRRRERSESVPPMGAERAGRKSREMTSAQTPAQTRRISTAVSDRVYQRDGGRCAWVDSGGRRCNATRWLEVDHVTPFGRGGSSDVSNLRLLCRAHNILAAEQAYGKGVMARFTVRE